ncbi:MAG: NUDIX hydrolase [Candidatus Hodarchaeales archaeon]
MTKFPLCLEELRVILQRISRVTIDIPEDFHQAAVLIPIFCSNNGWTLVFTRRTDTLRHHKGEISFPGGKFDDNQDVNLIQTALREANEEIGIKEVKVIGLLDDLLTISQFVVTPVIGFIEDSNEMNQVKINQPEIDYVLEAPISHLALPERFSIKKMTYQEDIVFQVPFFDFNGEIIWGATGRILMNLLKIFNHLNYQCKMELMGQKHWKISGRIDDGLEYIMDLERLPKKE